MDPRRPAFARDFPEDSALDELVLAFAAGNFARVRRGAKELAAATHDPKVREAIEEVRARTEPAPVATFLLIVTALVLVAVASYWVVQRGMRAAVPSEPPQVH